MFVLGFYVSMRPVWSDSEPWSLESFLRRQILFKDWNLSVSALQLCWLLSALSPAFPAEDVKLSKKEWLSDFLKQLNTELFNQA